MEFEFFFNRQARRISVEKKKDGRYVFRAGEVSFEAEVRPVSDHTLCFHIEGRTTRVFVAEDGNRIHVALPGRTYLFEKSKEEESRFERAEEGAEKGKPVVRAPMPGKVIKVCVVEGEPVRKNQALVIVEAMKMENELKSPVDGIVKRIFVSGGDLVDSEKALLELEPRS